MQKKTILLLLLMLLFLLPEASFAKNSSEDVLKKAQKELPEQCIFYFKMYLNATKPKAFAYAIDSKENVTCRFSTSSINQKRADEVALFSCQKSSIEKGIISDCKIYHTDTNITKSKNKLSFEEKYLINLRAIKKDITSTLKEQKKKKPIKVATKKVTKKPVQPSKPKPTTKNKTSTAKSDLKILPKQCNMFYNLYKKADTHKAFAIAIDDDKKYVCKFSAKSESKERAKMVALSSCERSRKERGIKHPCKLFIQKKTVESTSKVVFKKSIKKEEKTVKKVLAKPSHKKEEKKVITQTTPKNPLLEKAILHADLKNIKILISKGADIDTQSSDKSRALFVAVAQGDIAFTKTLFDKGAFPFFRKKDNNNLLVAAIMSGKNEMLQLILEHKLDPNIRCEEGNTPLHFALMMFDDKMMQTLYNFGARDDIKNKKEQSVQDLAKEYHVDLKRIKR